jgi:hypothetical protein
MLDKKELGSITARGGFANEHTIVKKFNNWKEDNHAQLWLSIMGYKIEKINSVDAVQIPIRIKKADISKFNVTEEEYKEFIKFKKADAQIRIYIIIGNILKIENISLKKANSNANYNQIDKRSVNTYQDMWNFDNEIATWLKLYSGEIIPKNAKSLIGKITPRDARRLYIDEMPELIQSKILNFFAINKILVISDVIKGRGGLSAGWMLITKNNVENDSSSWILKDINTTMNFYGMGKVLISKKGSLHIGRITMQRKSGTPDPTKLQFKFKPNDLFELE